MLAKALTRLQSRRRHSRHAPWVAAGATLLLLAPTAGDAQDARERQLEEVRARIEAATRELNETRGRRDALREEIRELERRVGALANAVRQSDRQIRGDQEKLRVLARKRERARGELAVHGGALEREIRLAYTLGRQDYLKLLLNQEDPAQVARSLTYHRYLNAARRERQTALRVKLAHIEELETQIRDRDRELAARRKRAAEEKREFDEARTRRAGLLAQRNREVRERARELDTLKADEQRLQGLVQRLTQYVPNLPPPEKDARFGTLKGRLPWPTRGRLQARYNEPKAVGNLRWRGLLIGAAEGTEIQAVASGRVVYADWLRGFGLLLILDHGDGYMTLYGHNQTLHKTVGNWVEAGEAVAAVGSSGDAIDTALYFEVRHRGEPIDPTVWIAGGGRAARR
ncbi:MAG: peptidoglycan DD-metalloendopeptidase family protein [Pseudomonadota bacterium]|nr:MAG: peptidoglycan DD-metalloendopeptidase family protein [Pseudomonadota bacterium]